MSILRFAFSAIVLVFLPEICNAQGSSAEVSPLGRAQGGWRFYNANFSFGYTTLALPTNSTVPAFSLGRIESDYDGTASSSLGYNYTGAKTRLSLIYSPSYARRVRFSQVKSFNQALNFTFSHQLAARWSFFTNAAGADTTLDQLMFAPAILSAATGPVATLDDLMHASKVGQYSSDQVASVLTGTPHVLTPSHSVIYGSSYLSTNVNSNFEYRHSSRLTLTFGGGYTRSLTRNDSEQNLRANYLIPSATSTQANTSISYSLSPRTQFVTTITSIRVRSSISRYITTNTSSFVNRRLTPNWFVEAGGGIGMINPLQEALSLPQSDYRLSYTSRGGLGYTARDHVLAGSYYRLVGDSFGFQSQSIDAFGGSWQWQHRESGSVFNTGGGTQRIRGGPLGDISYWYGNVSFTKTVSRQFSLNFAYAYVARPTQSLTPDQNLFLQRDLSGYSARITLVWSPLSREARAVEDGAGRSNTNIPGGSSTGLPSRR